MMASERSTVTETTGPHAPDDPRDPHGIFNDIGGVDEFLATHDADTLEEALRAAERAESTTDPETRPRCPECESIRLREKVGLVEREYQRPERFCCDTCGLHFDVPLPPEVER
jgi:uncharacterized paraquat-inducible protein A